MLKNILLTLAFIILFVSLAPSHAQASTKSYEYCDCVDKKRGDYLNQEINKCLALRAKMARCSTCNIENVVNKKDTMELARRILACKKIKFQDDKAGGRQRKHFAEIALTGKQKKCKQSNGKATIGSNLLYSILSVVSKYHYNIVIGVVAWDHDCYTTPHPSGKALDLNGVSGYVKVYVRNNKYSEEDERQQVTKYVSTGNSIEAAEFKGSSEVAQLIRRFYTDLGFVLSRNGGGKLGQIDCFGKTAPLLSSKIDPFGDDGCDHIHFQVNKKD